MLNWWLKVISIIRSYHVGAWIKYLIVRVFIQFAFSLSQIKVVIGQVLGLREALTALQSHTQGKKTIECFFSGVTVSDSLWFRHSAFCSAHLPLLLCLAGEAAAINKTQRWSVHPAVKSPSPRSLHHVESKYDFSSTPLQSFFLCNECWKIKSIYIDVVWRAQKHCKEFWMTSIQQISIKNPIFYDEQNLSTKRTCCIQLHQPHLGPSFTKTGQKLAAGPHHELISRVDDATAVKQDAAFVLDCQQIRLVFITSTIDVPEREERR